MQPGINYLVSWGFLPCKAWCLFFSQGRDTNGQRTMYRSTQFRPLTSAMYVCRSSGTEISSLTCPALPSGLMLQSPFCYLGGLFTCSLKPGSPVGAGAQPVASCAHAVRRPSWPASYACTYHAMWVCMRGHGALQLQRSPAATTARAVAGPCASGPPMGALHVCMAANKCGHTPIPFCRRMLSRKHSNELHGTGHGVQRRPHIRQGVA